MSTFRVEGQLSLDGARWQAGLSRAEAGVRGFASSVSNRLAAAFSIGALAQFTRSTIQLASHLRDVSDNLGVNVEWLQKIAGAARQAGASEDDLAKFMQSVQVKRQDAINNPQGRSAESFRTLGMSSGDISSLSAQAFFDKMVKAFSSGSNAELENSVIDVGGRAAKKLIGSFINGFDSAGVEIIPEELIDQIDELDDKFTVLSNNLRVGFAPIITWVLDKFIEFTNILKQVGAFIVGFIAALPGAIEKRDLGQALETGVRVSLEERLDQEAAARAGEDRRDSTRRARRRRETQAPELTPQSFAKTERASAPYSDALLRVGNFLGQGATQKMNTIANRTASATESIDRKMDTLIRNLTTSGNITD